MNGKQVILERLVQIFKRYTVRLWASFAFIVILQWSALCHSQTPFESHKKIIKDYLIYLNTQAHPKKGEWRLHDIISHDKVGDVFVSSGSYFVPNPEQPREGVSIDNAWGDYGVPNVLILEFEGQEQWVLSGFGLRVSELWGGEDFPESRLGVTRLTKDLYALSTSPPYVCCGNYTGVLGLDRIDIRFFNRTGVSAGIINSYNQDLHIEAKESNVVHVYGSGFALVDADGKQAIHA